MATPPTWKQIGENLVRYRGGTIYLRAKVGGKVVRKSLGTADVRIAKIKRDAELEKLRAAAEAGEAGGTGAAGIPATVGEALELVGKRVVNAAGLKPKTVSYYGQLFQTLRDTLPLDAVGASWSADGVAAWWKDYAGARSPQQANNALREVARVIEVFVDAGARSDNPARKLKPMKLVSRRIDDLPGLEEMETVLADVRGQGLRFSEECANFIEFLMWSGMRLGEVQGLRWEDVGAEWVMVTGGTGGTKNSERRRVPINEHLAGVIGRMRWGVEHEERGPVFSMISPVRALTGACRRLGLRHLRVHDLRHWFASRCIESGVDVPTMSRWLGHKDGGALAMRVYGHLRDDHSLASAAKLSHAPVTGQVAVG
ncbi:MAG: site-specific integrase [Akkermansiaceae bacterium]|nr:site-specific integrase [Akkermansiaceae bacterium]MCF7732109.1 site-specific integrase [Akkermansiaceae bacterium]